VGRPHSRNAAMDLTLCTAAIRFTSDPGHVDESELLTRLRAGDEDAYSTIFREHYPALVVNATRLLGERALAEEIAQDVLLELWRRRETLALTGPVRAYLHSATRNRALNRLREARTAQRGEIYIKGPSEAAPADARAISSELAKAVTAAIGSLSDPQREVFEMSRARGLTYNEIAAVLGISVKSVEARMGRALKQLREQLAAWLPDGGGW
jgi:RNA polymerase sigma-70 factor (ECF subfamily)